MELTLESGKAAYSLTFSLVSSWAPKSPNLWSAGVQFDAGALMQWDLGMPKAYILIQDK